MSKPVLKLIINNQVNNDLIKVHDVRNKSAGDAKKALEEQGFKVSFTCSAADIVTEQIPKPGTSLMEGAVIKIYSSETSGSKEKVEVPDLKGMSLKNAKSTLESKGLNIKTIGKGKVISQDPIAETQITEGSVVTVTLQEDVGASSH